MNCAGHGLTGPLTLNHIDLNRLDFDANFFEPFDGGLDIGALAVELQADDADFIGDARLADVGDDREICG